MGTLGLHLTLVKQGLEEVTINVNDVPLIPENMGLADKAAMVVNFLRSGCPAVQVVYKVHHRRSNPIHAGAIEDYEEPAEKFASDYEDKLQVLARANEWFSASALGPYFFVASN